MKMVVLIKSNASRAGPSWATHVALLMQYLARFTDRMSAYDRKHLLDALQLRNTMRPWQ